jgi:hypothetical protein
MARGGARPGAGRPARKSANTSTVTRRARAHARVEPGNQRPWPADKVERWAGGGGPTNRRRKAIGVRIKGRANACFERGIRSGQSGSVGDQKGGRWFLYSIKKEGTPASFTLKTARSTISR